MRRFLASSFCAATLWFMALPATPAHAIMIKYVIVDYRHSGCTIYYAIPREMIDERAPWTAREEDVDLVLWKKFKKNREKYVAPFILKNEHEGSRPAKKIVKLLGKHPMSRIGLTWTGKVVTTREDFEAAAFTYRFYMLNPEGYEKKREESLKKKSDKDRI